MQIKEIFNYLYSNNAIKRTIILWITVQLLLWLIFGISFFINEEAWVNVLEIEKGAAAVGGFWSTFFYIISHNLLLVIFIVIGNLFVRFGKITPGLLILILQVIGIGWLAGSNSFEVLFTSVLMANIQYLKIGLWEITVYVIVCAVTLPKSLYIADSFPATKWQEVRKFSDILLNKKEIILLFISIILLIMAATIEAFFLI